MEAALLDDCLTWVRRNLFFECDKDVNLILVSAFYNSSALRLGEEGAGRGAKVTCCMQMSLPITHVKMRVEW